MLPKVLEHRSDYVKTILEHLMVGRAQVAFIAAQFEPKFAFIARANSHGEEALELGG